ncbi:MAG: prephenate dehydrogenase/arogenate dehydrogenase family protein [Candidatus Omnitrophica bacterium]|nr:prephenate dehydrogenase/arogenate dehydrogenase family protein [Candidatus Omnitrophota bacterium]
MILRTKLFKRVTIVGVGLMGGSLGLAIKKNKIAREVVGYSHRQASLVQALKNKAVDIGYTDIAKAVRSSDLVVLATPVDAIIQMFNTINPLIKRNCIITDVGSAKTEIVDMANRYLSNPNMFVGSHPLVGSEKKGVMFASADLYEKALCLMTPTNKTSQMAKEKVKQLWMKVGANVKFISPDEHDNTLAYISHLPHLLAFGLMESIPEAFLKYSSQGLKDTSRIAASNPQMWSDICMANSKNVIHALDGFVKCLSQYRNAIIKQDQKSLIDSFTTAKNKRDQI